ncbi:phage uncharacterized protein TIGR01671 [Streptococcus equinus]|uniref:Phage uncharacterized protein TIGR01671 n=1 Tax=Streptococcus equinus TaxID=1335 RepID=A0A1H0Y2K6_STREI|nr:YopX family protein [Streptococcus equinus]QBX24865.1 hypothetical protein Javan214_0028 [Streptococcus phage Javan214]SDQ09166.1 phage uncharacterized protein TIGR01671 [Streptococcus equinus]
MRVPKFRAWLKPEQRMIGVYEMTFIDNEVLIISDDMDFYTDDEFKLMQFTGLHDVHGKEVFEGDLIATPFEEDGLFEVHMDTVAGVYTKSTLTGKVQFIEDLDSLEELEGSKAEFAEYIEVKGNIYENQELLGEEE